MRTWSGRSNTRRHMWGGHVLLACLAAGFWAAPLSAQRTDAPKVEQLPDGRIVAGEQVFDSWSEYVRSDFFESHGMRCGSAPVPHDNGHVQAAAGPEDCTYNVTDPEPVYDPSLALFRIPVVVHVIQNTSGQGFISEAMVQSQIDILNEDFLALFGTNGQNGTDVQIQFYLATEDPNGQPTNGITYSTNNQWFNDSGSYWNTLAWDTNRYMNVYTNSAGGFLGYVPDLPQGGIAGSNSDRVVVLWSAFGRNAPIGPPFDQGRTLTHEVGHYLGLWHPFDNGCGSATSCFTTGDRICDTPPEADPTFGCGDRGTCGFPDPFRNYMDYSDDLCMEEFTPEQSRRMRCSLEHYRSLLYETVNTECGNGVVEPGEECEPPGTFVCDENCERIPQCGDGIEDSGEECDDGNTNPGDGCDGSCQLEHFGNCCETGHGPGCSNTYIQDCVCAASAFCCTTDWNTVCVNLVESAGCAQCPECLSDADCSDGEPCNGLELCDPIDGVCVPAPPPDCEDGSPCTTGFCDPSFPGADPVTGCAQIEHPNGSTCDDPCLAAAACQAGQCVGVPALYADIAPPGGNGIIDVDDVLCVLAGFADPGSCPGGDLFPCSPNGTIDVDDVLASLNAFGGVFVCPHPCQ